MSLASEIVRGTTFGRYTVVRETYPDAKGRRHFTVRCRGCGAEKRAALHALRGARPLGCRACGKARSA